MESTLDGHRIDFELKWNDLYRATLYRINRTPFAGWWMVDEQPSCNCWFSSQLSVYMVSNAKRKWKSWLNIIKNIWEEVILYCFQICFPVSENTPLFLSLNKIHVTKFMQAHIYIYHVSIFLYLCPNVKFCQNNFPLPIVSHYHWTGNRKSVADGIWNPRAWNDELEKFAQDEKT